MSELHCSACVGLGKVHNHDQPGDDEDTGRVPIIAIALAYLLAGVVIAVLLLW